MSGPVIPGWQSQHLGGLGAWMGVSGTERKVREEFMFDVEPITGYRLWGVKTLAEAVDGMDFSGTARLMAEAYRERPANPYQYLLDEVRLTAIARNSEPWSPVPTEARCSHPAPSLQCECGYWALRAEENLLEAFDSYNPVAYGPVKLWGRFCEFEKGYRAQYAHPAEIVLLNGDQRLAERLAETYQVPARCGEIPETVRAAREERRKKLPEIKAMSFNTPPISTSAYLAQMQHYNSVLFGSNKKRRRLP